MVEADIYPIEHSAPPAANGAVSILLVDDDVRNLNVLESVLQSPDHHLVRAQSAEECLMALIHRNFAAIVLDVQMPGMSGFELARLIKQRKRNQHIPIIFLTAYFQEEKDVLQGYDVGAVDYLTKPVDPQILNSKVKVFVDLFRTTCALTAANEALEREIVEREQAELAVARLAAIVESSADAILSRTVEGIVTSWNAAAERLLGYTAAEIVGQSGAMLIPADRSDELEGLLEQIKSGEAVESRDTVRVRKDGRLIDVSLTLSPIKDASGNVSEISSIMRDISDRKRLEAEVLQAGEREQCRIAQDLHDGLGQLLAGISCLSDTLSKGLTDKALPEAAGAERISKLLDTAVAQSRVLARGLHPVAPEPDGLMAALEGLAASASSLFKVSCRFERRSPVRIGNADAATHLYRIAQEAVTNAIKHGRAKHIRIGLFSTPERVVLKVNDDGAGFPKAARRPVGMGLRIMNYRADVIGGTLGFQDMTGGGTEVSCVVPRTSALDAAE